MTKKRVKSVIDRSKRNPRRLADVGPRVKRVEVKRLTGYLGENWRLSAPELRPGQYVVEPVSVGCAAPKDFIRVYQPGPDVRRKVLKSWPAYIAKVGHQFYPAESVTEQLMTRCGECFGFDVAKSLLVGADQQIRFMSRYFLGDGEMLTHAAEILSVYLRDDDFVDHVADQRAEKEVFTFLDFAAAFKVLFPDSHEAIMLGLVRMIGFDAIVGNNDRHIYNWGIIESPTRAFPARFSPIFDTARGLYWNHTEDRIVLEGTQTKLERYIMGAAPMIGWEGGGTKMDHFELVRNVAQFSPKFKTELTRFAKKEYLHHCHDVVDLEFSRLLSEPRRSLIKKCLRLRFDRFCQAAED